MLDTSPISDYNIISTKSDSFLFIYQPYLI